MDKENSNSQGGLFDPLSIGQQMNESPNIDGGRVQHFGWPSDLMTNSSINSSIQQVEKILQQADPDDSGQAINFITHDPDKGKCVPQKFKCSK